MTRRVYSGSSRGLVLALDCGTTFSGISYAVLDPGEVPQIKGVTRFPAQESIGGTSKVPSILWYDTEGELRAAGAEALLPEIVEKAEDEEWIKAEWWKLHLAPLTLRTDLPKDWPPPLPYGKSVCDVFADFLAYLFKCARQYIEESHANGSMLWMTLQSNITVVLSHPNGWGGAQQSMMRRAAVQGGLVDDSDEGRARITFVTEGEASFNFCVQNGLSSEAIKVGNQIVVIDAGGGTVDVSAYVVENVQELSVKEMFAPECRMRGSATVTKRAGEHIAGKLRLSRFDTPVDIAHITNCFDATTKRMFKDIDEPVHVKFGSPRDKDIARGIRSGMLKLSGAEVALFFEPCLEAIQEAIDSHMHELRLDNTAVLLVGGFSESPWLFHQLKQRLGYLGLDVSRPDGQRNKAVADGAIAYHLDQIVTSRIARLTYGVDCTTLYDPTNVDHRIHSHRVYQALSGHERIPNAYGVILRKGTQVSGTQEFRRSFNQSTAHPQGIDSVSTDIMAYLGSAPDPRWTITEPHLFRRVCTVEADTSGVYKQALRNPQGDFYFSQTFDVVLFFGLTELKVHISWMEHGTEKTSTAKIIYTTGD